MKVAIACHPTHGGSGVVAAELGMELARRGNCVHFVSYEAPFRVDLLHENVAFHEVDVTSYPLFRYPPYALALATKLVEVVRTHGVQLLHVHYGIPHAISAILTRQMCQDCGIRVITTLHGTDITLVGADPSFKEITKFGIDQSNGVTAVSQYLADATHAEFGTDKEIRVIPNFVDSTVFSPARRSPCIRRRFADEGERLLIHISNFREVKRIPDVVATFARIAREIPSRLVMVGSGPERHAAEEQVEELGLTDRVTFLGPVDEVGGLVASSDLLLLPSRNESFGLAALEAMACGVPVVATRTGGLPELVSDGLTGILSDVGDVEDMSRKALAVLVDSDAYEAMSRAALAYVQDRYPMERVVDEYLEYYEAVLQDSPCPDSASVPGLERPRPVHGFRPDQL